MADLDWTAAETYESNRREAAVTRAITQELIAERFDANTWTVIYCDAQGNIKRHFIYEHKAGLLCTCAWGTHHPYTECKHTAAVQLELDHERTQDNG